MKYLPAHPFGVTLENLDRIFGATVRVDWVWIWDWIQNVELIQKAFQKRNFSPFEDWEIRRFYTVDFTVFRQCILHWTFRKFDVARRSFWCLTPERINAPSRIAARIQWIVTWITRHLVCNLSGRFQPIWALQMSQDELHLLFPPKCTGYCPAGRVKSEWPIRTDTINPSTFVCVQSLGIVTEYRHWVPYLGPVSVHRHCARLKRPILWNKRWALINEQ